MICLIHDLMELDEMKTKMAMMITNDEMIRGKHMLALATDPTEPAAKKKQEKIDYVERTASHTVKIRPFW